MDFSGDSWTSKNIEFIAHVNNMKTGHSNSSKENKPLTRGCSHFRHLKSQVSGLLPATSRISDDNFPVSSC